MHPALRLEEILLNIFGHCALPGRGDRVVVPDMVSLARTCRAFKEPALDVLWEEMHDPTPLVRCLPEACSRKPEISYCYSFHRSLTQTEWTVLRSYTCRIRCMQDFVLGIDEEVVTILSNPPTTEPLLPNLRCVHHYHVLPQWILSSLPFPSLTHLELILAGSDPDGRQEVLNLFSECSTIRFVYLDTDFELEEGDQVDITALDKSVSNTICRWQNLESVTCPNIMLDMDVLSHLSRVRALSCLTFRLGSALPLPPDTQLFFPKLHKLDVDTTSLGAISRLLSQARLPTITRLEATSGIRPSLPEFASFLACVHASGAGHTIQDLMVSDRHNLTGPDIHSRISFEYLRPCMSFSNLRSIHISIEWNVFLTNDDLLLLASAWPRLETLYINGWWGWNTDCCGITPDGLLQLLKACPSLHRISLVWDTRGYTKVPPSGLLERHGVTLPGSLFIDIIDSRIDAESVPAVAAFVSDTLAKCPHVSYEMRTTVSPEWREHRNRWHAVLYPEQDDPDHASGSASGASPSFIHLRVSLVISIWTGSLSHSRSESGSSLYSEEGEDADAEDTTNAHDSQDWRTEGEDRAEH